MVTLKGKLTPHSVLSGQIGITSTIYPVYTGGYDIESSTEAQTLLTANRIMKQDIIIKPIPYSETSNNADGITVFIGKERDL